MTAKQIIERYIAFFEKKGSVKIPNASLVPFNDPTTLFTSSGMQPLVPYLLGEQHPQGKRLVNVQNAFRAVDIDEIGNNRHTTFFRMLGNWSLGDYFKKEEIPWLYEFLTDQQKGLGIDPQRLHFTVFKGFEDIPQDNDAYHIWEEVLQKANITDYKDRLHWYGAEKNWWSRAGTPNKMPIGEIGGPDTEVFYDFGAELHIHENSLFKDEKCHPNCDCGRYWEIGNSVFMQYKKTADGSFEKLPKQNVDFGGGLERLLGAIENKSDIFQTSLFKPTIENIEQQTKTEYQTNKPAMQIIADHLGASCFIIANGIKPANKDQGYVLRRLLRRALDNFSILGGKDIAPIIETIIGQYKDTDPYLVEKFEEIKNTILEEEQKYTTTKETAKKFVEKKYGRHSGEEQCDDSRIAKRSWTSQDDGQKIGDELMGISEISAEDAFLLYTTHGLSPTQIKSLGYTFDDQQFAKMMEAHQKLSKAAGVKKFAGGLADHSEETIKGHTATHLLHQALRDILGDQVHQTGSNITSQRLRFDFNYDSKLTDYEIKKVEAIVNEKIAENLPVHFEIMGQDEAIESGAIGLFMDTYGDKIKIYFIGGTNPHKPHLNPLLKGEEDQGRAYSVEFCGGPHVDFTGALKRFTIIKQENLGKGQKRIYAKIT